jgi:hypothetical protein
MFEKKYIWIFVILILIIILVIVFSHSKKNNQPTTTYKISNIETQLIEPTESPSPTPATISNKTISVVDNSSPVPDGTRGQIVCNYQYPPTPGNFGDAKINANWNNLVPGKNGSVKLDICLSVNGNNSLLSTNLNQNGEMVVDAPWIALNTNYIFNLYDDHGGDIGTCGGTILSTCHINTVR